MQNDPVIVLDVSQSHSTHFPVWVSVNKLFGHVPLKQSSAFGSLQVSHFFPSKNELQKHVPSSLQACVGWSES